MRKYWIVPLTGVILSLFGLLYWNNNLLNERDQLNTYLNMRNQRAFYELMANVENMEVMLSKGIVSNSPNQRMMIFTDIWQHANVARENLSQMPLIAGSSLARTSKFLTQTGDYAWSLANKYNNGKEITADDIQKLNELHTEAGYLAAELQNVEKTTNGNFVWTKVKKAGNRLDDTNVPMSLQKIDKNMEDFPTLIYDGPFSDHIINRKPRGLTGSTISKDKAREKALEFTEKGSGTSYKTTKIEDVNGKIQAYRVTMIPTKGTEHIIITDVSKKGGHPLFMLNTRNINKANISLDEAVSMAKKFLDNNKLKNMKPTYVIEQQNTGVIIFQYEQDEVLIYPDLIKVKVALDNGEIVGFEGMGYVMNHFKRNVPEPKITEKQALNAVNPQFKVKSKRLAIIPLENLEEVLAYEFKGEINGDEFIVYINALTGKEEKILKVIHSNRGILTM